MESQGNPPVSPTPSIPDVPTSTPSFGRVINPQDHSYSYIAEPSSVQTDAVPDDMNTRTRQQEIIPNAVANRFFGNLISQSSVVSTVVSAAVSTNYTISSTITDNANQVIFAIPQVSVYVGINNINQISNSNLWPTLTIGQASLSVTVNPAEYQNSKVSNQICRVSIRNNISSSLQLLVVVQWKILTVPSVTQSTISQFSGSNSQVSVSGGKGGG